MASTSLRIYTSNFGAPVFERWLQALFIVLAIASSAHAGTFLKVECDPRNHTLSIVSGAVNFESQVPKVFEPNFVLRTDDFDTNSPVISEGECRWSDGTDILIHWGRGSLVGASEWEQDFRRLSVWVNRAKWVNHVVSNDDGNEMLWQAHYTTVDSVMINKRGMTTCSTYRPNGSQRCKSTTRAGFSTKTDKVEYPPGRVSRLSPGTVRVIESHAGGLCELLATSRYPWSSGPFPSEVTPPIGSSVGIADAMSNIVSALSFDIDNDGQPELVLERHEYSHSAEQDVFYVYDEARLKALDPKSASLDDDLIQGALYIYPWSWECAGWKQHACEPEIGDSKLPFRMIDTDGKVIQFRDRYLYVWPMRWKGTTYLTLSTSEEDLRHAAFVIKPLPRGQYEVSCVLESVSLNF